MATATLSDRLERLASYLYTTLTADALYPPKPWDQITRAEIKDYWLRYADQLMPVVERFIREELQA